MNEGWIKIYRKIKEHWLWDNPQYLHAWVNILMTVNYEPKRVLIQGELYECGKGQSLLSLQNWTKQFGKGWTIQRTRTFFELLKGDAMVNTEGLHKTTRLTVCKYGDYQELQQAKNKPKTSKEQANNTPVTTTKEGEEVIDESITKEVKNKIDFDLVFEKWLNYKKERRETYKSESSQLVCYNQLVKYSGNDPIKANEIIEYSMAGNYMGFFKPKNNQNNKPIPENKSIGIPKDGW